jgi:hypothetical protein
MQLKVYSTCNKRGIFVLESRLGRGNGENNGITHLDKSTTERTIVSVLQQNYASTYPVIILMTYRLGLRAVYFGTGMNIAY